MHTSASRLQMERRYRTIPLSLEKKPTLLEQANPNGIQARFERFHAENPHVYATLKRLALELLAQGFKNYSIDGLMHVARYHIVRATKSTEPFKLNDHFTSRYARLLMDSEPELEDFFELRSLRSA